MGFPEWTLWGMSVSALGALLALALALIGQSPGFIKRVGLSGSRLDLRVRAFTGYAFALLLLAIGFFVAGVPLSPTAELPAAQAPTAESTPNSEPTSVGEVVEEAPTGATSTPSTPVTGAFGGPPRTTLTPPTGEPGSAATTSADTPAAPSRTPTQPPAGDTRTPSPAPSATPTNTPTPTVTPTPTLTPTPIRGETAVVNTGGGSIWMRRSPGGQNLVLVNHGDTVILLSGHANQGGILWREVSTVSGVAGWLQEEFLDFPESP